MERPKITSGKMLLLASFRPNFCIDCVQICINETIIFSYFPFWLSAASLTKPISLKYIGHGIRYNSIGKRKLIPVHGLSV